MPAVVSAGVVSAGAAVVSVGSNVVGGTVVTAGTVTTGSGDDPRSLFGRSTQISTAVTTMIASRRQHRDRELSAVPGRLVRAASFRWAHRFRNLPIRMDAS